MLFEVQEFDGDTHQVVDKRNFQQFGKAVEYYQLCMIVAEIHGSRNYFSYPKAVNN